jgi:hypothetical protein
VPFELGDGAGSALYPSTMFRIGNVDAERAQAAIGEFKAIDALMERGRRPLPLPAPRRHPAAAAQPARMARQRHPAGQRPRAGGGRHRRAQLSAAEVEGRRQIVEYMRFLRAEVPGFEAPR